MTKLLLTTVFRPFGTENKYNKAGDEFLLDYLASRLTREPGLFSLSSYVPHSSLHLIAANLPVETKVFEYPSVDEFVEEVKKGYDYVGINFLIKGFRKVFHMIALIRKHSPKTKIVIGGFGTRLHNIEDLGADYVCQGEGVRFMRRLLGVNESLKVVHPIITADVTLKIFQNYDFLNNSKMGLVTSGFGCPNTCEFCCTSSYYGHKSIPFLQTGQELYDAMLYMHNNTNGVNHFLIFEEDFMLYKDKVNELGKCIEGDKDHDFTYGCFASARALSNYDFEALVSGGLGHVWVGIESMEAPFRKRKVSDLNEVFSRLHSLGVTTTGSSIFGLDHHTPVTLPQEVNYVIDLCPSTVQLSNLMPAEGTPLRRRLEKAGRIHTLGFKDADLYSEVIDHPNFSPGEINSAIFGGYEKIYHTIGPSIYRILETWFAGYKNLKKSLTNTLNRRAGLYEQKIKGLLPVFLNTNQYLPNEDIKDKVGNTLEEIISEFGAPTPEQVEKSSLIGKIFDLEDVKKRTLKDKPIEPDLSITNYSSNYFYKNSS